MRYLFRDTVSMLIGNNQRTVNVIKNTLMSAGMKVVSLLCSLVMVPLTINYLNTENYGIWMAMTSVLYWFVFFDVGLGNGMRNYLAEAWSLGDYGKARSYFSTAIFILAFIAMLIGIISVPLIYFANLNELFNVYSIEGLQLSNVLMIAVFFSLLQFVVKNVGMVYIAMQKYAANEFILFLSNIIIVIAIYVLTKTVPANLGLVVAVFTGVPVVMFVLSAIPLLRKYPQLTPSIRSIDFDSAKRIVSKGVGFFIIQITSCLVIFGSANVLISHYCGPEDVTVYNIAYKYFNVLVIGYTIVISPLWNAYTDAAAKGDYSWIRNIFRKSLFLWGASVLGGVIALLCSSWFFEIWIGDTVSVPFVVSACVLAYVCLFNLNNCVTYLINGLNKIKVQIITSVAVTVLYLITVFCIKGMYGIVGISLSMVMAYLLMSSVHIYQCHKLISKTAKGIWNK